MSDVVAKDSGSILCDMCTEEDRKPARKTCMKCEISMCVQHLQAHLTTPVLLQTHPLTEPMALDGNTKCPQHGKLLEYYCLDDMTCVCVSCAIEDQHRLHNMKTFSTAHKELLEKLRAEQEALQVKTEGDNMSLEKWEKSEREKTARCSVRLIEAVTNLRDISLTSVQSSVSARMVSIRTSRSSMQEAQNEKDTFRFLQMYSQVNQDVEKAKAVDLRKGLEPGISRDKLVLEIRQNGEKMVNQASDFVESLLTLIDPESHHDLKTPSDLIFEPQTSNSSMSLSKDKRMVFYNSWLDQCSATFLIHSTLPVPNYQRWIIRLEHPDWMIGLCEKQSAKNVMNGPVYGLSCENNCLSWVTTKGDKDPGAINTTVCSNQPETVEVLWNVKSLKLSFFRRTGRFQREKIITIKTSRNNWELVPFVQLRKGNVPNYLQQQWRCSCGRKLQSYQTHCPNCGKMFTITEVVCELC